MERLFEDDLTKGLATIITLQDLKELAVDEHDLQGISNFLNAMLTEEYDVVAVYRELPEGGLKCSLRSRLTDVAALAKSLSPQGGGHRLASGFKLPHAKAVQDNGVWRINK
jgi:nanoRNase/pAp phosphatase (c-di-AMP/oligoRNAs hydrolase)